MHEKLSDIEQEYDKATSSCRLVISGMKWVYCVDSYPALNAFVKKYDFDAIIDLAIKQRHLQHVHVRPIVPILESYEESGGEIKKKLLESRGFGEEGEDLLWVKLLKSSAGDEKLQCQMIKYFAEKGILFQNEGSSLNLTIRVHVTDTKSGVIKGCVTVKNYENILFILRSQSSGAFIEEASIGEDKPAALESDWGNELRDFAQVFSPKYLDHPPHSQDGSINLVECLGNEGFGLQEGSAEVAGVH